jgi:flagellar FliL protein
MKKMMNLLGRLGLMLLVLPLVGVNLAMAYIMFAPDTWPKPFYLMYTYPQPPATSEAGQSGTPQAASNETASPAKAASSETGENSKSAPPSAPLEIRPGQGLMVDTGSKIVNLIDPTGRRYLRAGIVLEFAPKDLRYYVMTAEEKKVFLDEFNAEITGILPVINDIIITSLSTQTFESVYTAEGKEKLRKQIMDTINQQLPEQRVIFVYFTEFVVQ